MDTLDIARHFPQFGKHLSSLVRPRSEVFRSKGSCGCGSGKGACGCTGGKGSCGCTVAIEKTDHPCPIPHRQSGSSGNSLGAPLTPLLGERPLLNSMSLVSRQRLQVSVPQDQRDPNRKCGPDITDYVAQKLTEVSAWSTHCFPGGELDFKGSTGSKRCPLNCEGFTFCGACVHPDVPGNICLGYAVGFASAYTIGMLDALVSQGESGEDATSYYAGDGLPHTNDAKKMKEALCRKFKALKNRAVFAPPQARDAYGFEDMPCTLCTEEVSDGPRRHRDPRWRVANNDIIGSRAPRDSLGNLGPIEGFDPWSGSWNPPGGTYFPNE